MNENEEFDLGGLVSSLLQSGIFMLGAVLMFFKTSELLSAFAPKSLYGYTGIESIYGFLSALMVEGVFVTVHFTLKSSKNPIAWLWNIMLIVLTFLISSLAQIFDGFLVQETITQQPAEIQFLVTWGVPAIPAFVIGLLLTKSVVESIPNGMFKGVHFPKSKNVSVLGALGNLLGKLGKSPNREVTQMAHDEPLIDELNPTTGS